MNVKLTFVCQRCGLVVGFGAMFQSNHHPATWVHARLSRMMSLTTSPIVGPIVDPI